MLAIWNLQFLLSDTNSLGTQALGNPLSLAQIPCAHTCPVLQQV